MEYKICKKRQSIIDSKDHLLIEGGPGSGKTTIALLKAKAIIDEKLLKSNQKILFLSFARATISRIEEDAIKVFKPVDKKQLEINTYHGFCWSVIRSFGYLLYPHRYFKLLTPPNEAVLLGDMVAGLHYDFLKKILVDDGILAFRFFAETCASILAESKKICSLLSNAYPFIIVDEFQDTDTDEWKLIQLLGTGSIVIALADLNQRIFEFRGASLTRIPEFKNHFKSALHVDLGIENNRSPNTDIVQYGDDMLTGINKGRTYKNVQIIKYQFYKDSKSHLRFQILRSIERLKKTVTERGWSIAVLVKSKNETLSLSSYLTLHNIFHDVLIDPSGPALSAALIAKMLEPATGNGSIEKILTEELINHVKGRKGNKISKKDNELAGWLEKYLSTGKLTGPARKKLVEEIKSIATKLYEMKFAGSPETDWLSIRKLFQDASHEALKNVYEDARFLRLLNKGAALSESLAELWRQNGIYQGAAGVVDTALMKDHFSMANTVLKGIIIMNMHKAKGKEFDEVIIWEEIYKQIVPEFADENRIRSERLLLRVAVTRAKKATTILTPASSPGILF